MKFVSFDVLRFWPSELFLIYLIKGVLGPVYLSRALAARRSRTKRRCLGLVQEGSAFVNVFKSLFELKHRNYT